MPATKKDDDHKAQGQRAHTSKDQAGDHDNSHTGHGKQGFASMPKEQVREIAKKGGEASHGGQGHHKDDAEHTKDHTSKDKDHTSKDQAGDHDNSHTGHGKQGFASMPKEQVREIAKKGGEASHGGHGHTEKSGSK